MKLGMNIFEYLIIDLKNHDPGKLIYNLSSHLLTPSQESLLKKGLNFTIPPKKIKIEDYCVPFEILFQNLKKDHTLSPENFEYTKTKLKETCFSSCRFYNKKNHNFENLTEDEYSALQELISLENIVIQKADKGNVAVLIDKDTYNFQIEKILSDNSKFNKLNINEDKVIQKLIETEEKIRKIIKPLNEKGVISDYVRAKLIPSGSQPGRLYGLCKVHKDSVDGCKPFRPILSAINTPTYEISKFLIPLLEPLTKNNYVTKDSFTFAGDIKNQNKDLFMASYDINSLFTNIPLDEVIDICVDKLYPVDNLKVNGLTKQEFVSLITLATKESLFIFNDKYYKQTDGVAMGSPLGPTLANVFLCYHEENWLATCPKQFKCSYYKRYVDDIFCLFENKSQVNKFHKYIGSRHPNIGFTVETEVDSGLNFLDIKITRGDYFVTSVYRKPTFSGIYMNFKAHAPLTYKLGLIACLLHRIYTICSDWEKIHTEINFLKCVLIRNGYPAGIINRSISIFLQKLFIKNEKPASVEKREFVICLPFLGSETLMVKSKLKKLFAAVFPAYKIKIALRAGIKIGSLFNYKDKISSKSRSHVVYKFTCGDCNVTYIGKTIRHFKVRMCEHLGISHITGKLRKYNPNQDTAIKKHLRDTGHQCSCDNFEIINRANTDLELLIKESLLINKHNPVLNKQIKNYTLSLF